MNADYAVIRFSDSEWSRILKAGGLVVFGASCLVLQLDLC